MFYGPGRSVSLNNADDEAPRGPVASSAGVAALTMALEYEGVTIDNGDMDLRTEHATVLEGVAKTGFECRKAQALQNELV